MQVKTSPNMVNSPKDTDVFIPDHELYHHLTSNQAQYEILNDFQMYVQRKLLYPEDFKQENNRLTDKQKKALKLNYNQFKKHKKVEGKIKNDSQKQQNTQNPQNNNFFQQTNTQFYTENNPLDEQDLQFEGEISKKQLYYQQESQKFNTQEETKPTFRNLDTQQLKSNNTERYQSRQDYCLTSSSQNRESQVIQFQQQQQFKNGNTPKFALQLGSQYSQPEYSQSQYTFSQQRGKNTNSMQNFYGKDFTQNQEKQLNKYRKKHNTQSWSQNFATYKKQRVKEMIEGQEILQYNFHQAKRREAEQSNNLNEFLKNTTKSHKNLDNDKQQNKLSHLQQVHVKRVQSSYNRKPNQTMNIPSNDTYYQDQKLRKLKQQNEEIDEYKQKQLDLKEEMQIQRQEQALQHHVNRIASAKFFNQQFKYEITPNESFQQSVHSNSFDQEQLLGSKDQIDLIEDNEIDYQKTNIRLPYQNFGKFSNTNVIKSREQKKKQSLHSDNLKNKGFHIQKPEEMLPFPQWLQGHPKYESLSQTKQFNMDQKILAVCDQESYKRSVDDKQIVGMFLQKIPLFRLMSEDLIQEISGHLQTKVFKDGQYVCKRGDSADCMYIIYSGQIVQSSDTEQPKIFHPCEFFGKTAIENNEKRTEDYKAIGNTYLLSLSRMGYQQCLQIVLEKQKQEIKSFLLKIQFFNQHFKEEQILKIFDLVKARYYAPKENVYMSGKKTDNFYIVMRGKLVQRVNVPINSENKWPMYQNGLIKWQKRICSKQVEYTTIYEKTDILGYYDLIFPNTDFVRTETVDALEESLILYINKIDFLTIFSREDYEFFDDYHKRRYQVTIEEREKKVKEEECMHKKTLKAYEDAIRTNLRSYNNQELNLKSKKLIPIMQQGSLTRKQKFKQKLPYTLERPEYNIVNTMYD